MYLVIFIAGMLLGEIVSNVLRGLFIRELPEMSRADLIFRISLVVIGVVGLIVTAIIKHKRVKDA